MLRLIPLLLILLLSTSARADAPFVIEPITIQVPAGFEGPFKQDFEGSTTVAFRKMHRDLNNATLLQVSRHDFGPTFPKLTAQDRPTATLNYLLQFLKGIERRRSGFTRTAPVAVKLAGIPASKIQWTGKADKIETVGVMYCVIIGTTVVVFHTQDIGMEPTAAMREAMNSIEAIKL